MKVGGEGKVTAMKVIYLVLGRVVYRRVLVLVLGLWVSKISI